MDSWGLTLRVHMDKCALKPHTLTRGERVRLSEEEEEEEKNISHNSIYLLEWPISPTGARNK